MLTVYPEPPRKKLHSSTRVRSPPGIVLSSESESKPAKRSSPGGDLSDPGRENSDNYVVVNNPMFDPDGKEIDEPASDGNNELAEEREHEVGFVFQNEFVLPGPRPYITSYLHCYSDSHPIRYSRSADLQTGGPKQRHSSRKILSSCPLSAVSLFQRFKPPCIIINGWGRMVVS